MSMFTYMESRYSQSEIGTEAIPRLFLIRAYQRFNFLVKLLYFALREK